MSVVNVTKNNFESEISNSNVPVLVDFWAPWCGPCRMLSPIVDEISEDEKLINTVKFCKINIDDEPDLAQKFSVFSIPTLKLFKNGNAVTDSVGLVTKSQIYDLIAKAE